eukprot:9479739-Pyramimonas_sp.AAC.1
MIVPAILPTLPEPNSSASSLTWDVERPPGTWNPQQVTYEELPANQLRQALLLLHHLFPTLTEDKLDYIHYLLHNPSALLIRDDGVEPFDPYDEDIVTIVPPSAHRAPLPHGARSDAHSGSSSADGLAARPEGAHPLQSLPGALHDHDAPAQAHPSEAAGHQG